MSDKDGDSDVDCIRCIYIWNFICIALCLSLFVPAQLIIKMKEEEGERENKQKETSRCI